jgi:phosphatidylglycerophosphate synthase
MSFVHSVGDFYRVNRGGGLYSEAVSQRFGAIIALVAQRWGQPPTVVTLGNLALGLATSIMVALNADRMTPVIGVLALLGWQVAYAMDCADGQLARVTGQASPAGARVDVLCDVASHIALVSALVLVARPSLVLAALFAGTWMINIVTSVLGGSHAVSLAPSQHPAVRVIKLVRDYGAVALIAGLILAIHPRWMIGFVIAMSLINGAFLAASIAQSASAALARTKA